MQREIADWLEQPSGLGGASGAQVVTHLDPDQSTKPTVGRAQGDPRIQGILVP